MENNLNFDELTRKAFQSGAMDDFNDLHGAVFNLEKWIFIVRGKLPNVSPYMASYDGYEDGKDLIHAFTDAGRMQRFAEENNLTEPDRSVLSLEIPTKGIIEYLEQFIPQGVHGILFNADSGSENFFIELEHLRLTKRVIESLGLIQEPKPKIPLVTVFCMMKDGLMFPSGFIKEASHNSYCFCLIPQNWTDGEEFKEFAREKLFEKLYGKNWRAGNIDGSRYVACDVKWKILTPEKALEFGWNQLVDNQEYHFFFYIADENGELQKADKEIFEANIKTSIHPAVSNQTTNSAYKFFRQGSVKPSTSLTPFFQAIVPILENYQGAGEFRKMFSPGKDESDMSNLFEDITSNVNGAYLKYRSYTYCPTIADKTAHYQTIGSNLLKHVQTGEKLRVYFTLETKQSDSITKLLVIFLGSKDEVKKLGTAIQSALDDCEFKVLLETDDIASPEIAQQLDD